MSSKCGRRRDSSIKRTQELISFKIRKLNNTTPSYFETLNLLQIANDKRIKFVFMEVSSIGYCEGRIGNLMYNYCILTNLESDHLDYHKTINNYHTTRF